MRSLTCTEQASILDLSSEFLRYGISCLTTALETGTIVVPFTNEESEASESQGYLSEDTRKLS